MFAWVSRFAALFLVLCVACGADEAAEPAAPSEAEVVDPVADEPVEDLEDEQLDDEAPLEVNVDEMDEHALEAACFAGQQAACDQLGH